MKKKLLGIILIVTMMFGIVGCAGIETVDDNKQTSMFIEVEQTSLWKVVYHRDTKVMYAVSFASYNNGTFTLLVNEDGTPMLYEELGK